MEGQAKQNFPAFRPHFRSPRSTLVFGMLQAFLKTGRAPNFEILDRRRHTAVGGT
jgi:hypothetical protein